MSPADTSEGITWAKVPGGFKIVESEVRPSRVSFSQAVKEHEDFQPCAHEPITIPATSIDAELSRQATLPQTMSGWWDELWGKV